MSRHSKREEEETRLEPLYDAEGSRKGSVAELAPKWKEKERASPPPMKTATAGRGRKKKGRIATSRQPHQARNESVDCQKGRAFVKKEPPRSPGPKKLPVAAKKSAGLRKKKNCNSAPLEGVVARHGVKKIDSARAPKKKWD